MSDIEDILNLLGVSDKPKVVAPPQDPASERAARDQRHLDALRNTEDATDRAHVIMPTDMVDRYKEYDRRPGGAHYTGDFDPLKAVVAEQGKIRSPLWISTDGEKGLLVEGNNRLAVAKELGTPELPVRFTFDREVLHNEGHAPVTLDDQIKKWIEENRIPGKYGRDAFPEDLVPQRIAQKMLYRGMKTTLPHNIQDAIKSGDPAASRMVLDFLSNPTAAQRKFLQDQNLGVPQEGLGTHWTKKEWFAKQAAEQFGHGENVVAIAGEWTGKGVYRGKDRNELIGAIPGGTKHEAEVLLDPKRVATEINPTYVDAWVEGKKYRLPVEPPPERVIPGLDAGPADPMLTLYHATDERTAQRILDEQFLHGRGGPRPGEPYIPSREPRRPDWGPEYPVYFSDSPKSHYGKSVVSVQVPQSKAFLDEANMYGHREFAVDQRDLAGLPISPYVPHTPSRKSRSLASPEHRADIMRYAPEEAYRTAVKEVNHRVVQYVQQAYRSDPRFLTDQAHIDRLTALMAPAVEAGQLQIADLTNAHLSTLFGVEHPPAPDLSSFARQGVTRATELARPFWTAIKAAKSGKDIDAALAAGEARLSKMVETDLQMAKVRQAREVLKAGGIHRYARVTGGKACWLCEIAATQVYYTEDLLPIHPSCVVGETLVAVPSDQTGSAGLLGAIEAATRQKFVGEVVELSTASGNQLTVTPNHPVLTDKGWIPAGQIRKGDNVFRSLRGKRPVDGRPDVAQHPSRIEDVFTAASVTGRLLRVPTTAEDFHGDGSDNEVDVVWTASDFAPPLDMLDVQQIGELCLMHAHGAGIPLVGQGALDGLVGSRLAASRSDIRSGGDRGAFLDGGAFVSQHGGVTRPARFNPTAAQFAGDGRSSYAEQGRALIDRLAGKVERDSVIECRLISFAGHVFNLQTAEGWYVADNIVLSNCNCSVQPIPDGGEDEIRDGFTPEEILAHSDEQVRTMTGLVKDDAPVEDYQKLLAVRNHGEIGPTLTWKHQSFTGPSDLPIPPSREVLEHQAYQSVKDTGGVTIDLAGNSPTDGYAYAPFKGTEMVVPQDKFTPEHIDRYINLHADELAQPGNHLGMWTDNGNIYLDVSQVGHPTAQTLAKAQAAHQLAVYDLGRNNEITLGTINDAGNYRPLASPADIHHQYREQVAAADEGLSAGRIPGVAGLEGPSAATELTWDGPPVAKPYSLGNSKRANTLYEDLSANWQSVDFDSYKQDMREGARDVQSFGYRGATKEADEMGIRLPRESDLGYDPDPRLLQVEGREIGALAAHADPSDSEWFRGMPVKAADLDRILSGESTEFSFPASSFGSEATAQQFARGAGPWQSDDAITGGKPVVFVLDPGAKLAHVGLEEVTFGRFERSGPIEVIDDIPYVRIRQTSMIEDEVAHPIPGTSVLERPAKIPEYTIVGQPEPGQPPAGMDREKWITTVQPGPIPDYDNPYAVTSQLKARHPDLDANLGSMLDSSLARSTAQQIDDLMTKYPAAQLRSVRSQGAHGFQSPNRFAQTDVYDRKILTGTEIQLNHDFYTSRESLERSYAKTTDIASRHPVPGTHPIYGYHPPLAEGVDAAKAIAAHEFGHTMDASGSYRASAAVKDTLRREYLRLNPYTDEMKAADRTLVANAAKRGITIRQPIETRYEAWLQDSLPGYAFTKDGRLNPTEALAEAFGHGEYDPTHLTDAERALHKLAVDMHDLPYRRDMKVPEWQMATGAKEAAMSKESKRLLKDYQKQVDAAVKKAKKAEDQAKWLAAEAQWRAEQAGQLFDPKLFPAPPKPKPFTAKDLPKEDIKSIRRFGGTDLAAQTPVIKSTRRTASGKVSSDWGATWKQLPPITVDLEGHIVDPALEANLRLVMESASKHPWVIAAGDRWYPDYSDFVRHQWEMAGKKNPITGKLMTFEQAMDASGAYAINAPWNETMANFHNWSIAKPNPKDKRNPMANAASIADASITSGHWVDRVEKAGTARKINDFTLNGKGDLSTSTTDRVMSRLALGTDDADFAAGLLGAADAGGYIDPVTGKFVKLSGYERISQAADRVSIAMGAPNEAAGQARMWIEFFGPEAAFGLPPDDVVAAGLPAINKWVEEQVTASAGGVHIPIGAYKAKGLNPSRVKA